MRGGASKGASKGGRTSKLISVEGRNKGGSEAREEEREINGCQVSCFHSGQNTKTAGVTVKVLKNFKLRLDNGVCVRWSWGSWWSWWSWGSWVFSQISDEPSCGDQKVVFILNLFFICVVQFYFQDLFSFPQEQSHCAQTDKNVTKST